MLPNGLNISQDVLLSITIRYLLGIWQLILYKTKKYWFRALYVFLEVGHNEDMNIKISWGSCCMNALNVLHLFCNYVWRTGVMSLPATGSNYTWSGWNNQVEWQTQRNVNTLQRTCWNSLWRHEFMLAPSIVPRQWDGGCDRDPPARQMRISHIVYIVVVDGLSPQGASRHDNDLVPSEYTGLSMQMASNSGGTDTDQLALIVCNYL